METINVLSKGQIVIPAALRKKFKIEPGSSIQIFEYENLICIIPPSSDPVKDAMGCLPKHPSLSNALLEERKKDSI